MRFALILIQAKNIIVLYKHYRRQGNIYDDNRDVHMIFVIHSLETWYVYMYCLLMFNHKCLQPLREKCFVYEGTITFRIMSGAMSSWQNQDMETLSIVLALREGNPLIGGK